MSVPNGASDGHAASSAAVVPAPSATVSLTRATRSSTQAAASGTDSDAPLFYSILVHNLSHSDLMVGLKSPDAVASGGGSGVAAATSTSSVSPPLPASIIARPKFNRFKQISGRLLTYVENQSMVMQGVEFPSPLAASQARAATGGSVAPVPSSPSASSSGVGCPYGFRVKDGQMKFQDWDAFKLKGDDLASYAQRMPKPEVVAAYFPMLAVLVPRWLSIVAAKNARRGLQRSDQSRKVLYLISGAGMPWNAEHDSSGNSTKGVAKLASWFLAHFYPEIEVQIIHSGVEIFHYDANVSFVNKELKPRIEEVRRRLARKYFDKWPKHMHLAITLTDGASARISAINASLRHLKPDCLHLWHLKSFWHEYPFITGTKQETDVEFHEFEKLEMTPPTLVSDTDNWTKLLVKEMIAHKEEFERVRDTEPRAHEIDTFWLRKSRQPVLSVLLVKKKNKAIKLYRGINVEVSMPTGSLCSERNAIGSALSADPTLARADLRMIAVLAVPLDPQTQTTTHTRTVATAMTPASTTREVATHANGCVHAAAGDDALLDATTDAHMTDAVEAPSVRSSQRMALTRQTSASSTSSNSMPPPSSPALKTRASSFSAAAAAASVLPAPAVKSSHEENVLGSPRKRKATNSPSTAVRTVVAPSAAAIMPRDLLGEAATGTAAFVAPIVPPSRSPNTTPTPASPRMQTRGSIAAVAAPPSKEDFTSSRKRMRRSNSVSAPAGAAAADATPPITPRDADADGGVLDAAPSVHLDRCVSSESSALVSRASSDDRNPLGPCGACNEWLKKIAEVNPEFKIVTFTDTECGTCFVKAVKF